MGRLRPGPAVAEELGRRACCHIRERVGEQRITLYIPDYSVMGLICKLPHGYLTVGLALISLCPPFYLNAPLFLVLPFKHLHFTPHLFLSWCPSSLLVFRRSALSFHPLVKTFKDELHRAKRCSVTTEEEFVSHVFFKIFSVKSDLTPFRITSYSA